MRPLKRKFVNKKKSSQNFRKKVGKTKSVNLRPQPMRGGTRL